LLNEAIEAWRYGPVIPSVYQQFKDFGPKPIQNIPDVYDLSSLLADVETVGLLNMVWSAFKGFTPFKLSEMTHLSGSPWEIVFKESKDTYSRNASISNKLIQKYFKGLLNRDSSCD
jgi:uncharacterized phage-associated protein